jgi:hypothetical protein
VDNAIRCLRSQTRQASQGEVDYRFGKSWRSVERLGAFEAHAELGAILAESNVYIVKNFDVVTEKADGLQK